MKVLYVEDNEQDADLTCRRLARLAPDVEVTTVHTLAGARERLAAHEVAGMTASSQGRTARKRQCFRSNRSKIDAFGRFRPTCDCSRAM